MNERISNGKKKFLLVDLARGEIEDTFEFGNSVDKLFYDYKLSGTCFA